MVMENEIRNEIQMYTRKETLFLVTLHKAASSSSSEGDRYRQVLMYLIFFIWSLQ